MSGVGGEDWLYHEVAAIVGCTVAELKTRISSEELTNWHAWLLQRYPKSD